jgi:N-methylhydantoinase A
VVGAAWAAEASGFADLLAFDMGGTSTDVAPVLDGEAQRTTESVVAGVPLKLPMVDVHTVSAGGGSVAWADEGGALRVGPRSAGAEPGPACYGRGGDDATVTDASLLLGYLADGAELGGEVVLDGARAEAALRRAGEPLALDPLETALGIVRVANAEMSRALRVISVERGLDPRDFALVAFGGAGGLHACALAEELGMGTVVVPRAAGVLSALGLAISDVRRDFSLAQPGEPDPTAMERGFAALETEARGALDDPELRRRADLRYRRQSFELTVAADDLDGLSERFHAAHEQRYGYRMEDEPVELVTLRLTATVPIEKPALAAPASPRGTLEVHLPGRRQCCFDGDWVATTVHAADSLRAGTELRGPAVAELPGATCMIRPGWAGEVDSAGALVLRRGGPA